MDERWYEYIVMLHGEDGESIWRYEEMASDSKTAWIQARLTHLGLGLPPVRQTFSLDDVWLV